MNVNHRNSTHDIYKNARSLDYNCEDMPRSFFLYKLAMDDSLPSNFEDSFSKSRIKDNIKEIELSKDDKRTYLLVVDKKEANYIYGYFFQLRDDLSRSILDLSSGEITLEKLEKDKSIIEKSHFVLDLSRKLFLGEFNQNGIRYFRPLENYLNDRLGREDIQVELVLNKEAYSVNESKVKSIFVRISRPKLALYSDMFGLTIPETITNSAPKKNDNGFYIEIKISSGNRKTLQKDFVNRIMERFEGIRDPNAVKRLQIKETDHDIPYELVGEKKLRRKIELEGKSKEEIFSDIVTVYEDLNLEELFDGEEDDDED